MRILVKAMILGLALLASSVVVQARGLLRSAGRQAAASPITLRVAAGYGNIYRDSTWTPVRVTLHNGGSGDISGSLRIPESSLGPSLGSSQSFHALYEAPVTVPSGGTKVVTVYVPGSGVQGRVDARFQQGNTTLAAGSALPIGVDTSALTIGVLANAPSDRAWLYIAAQQHITTHVIAVDPAVIDPVPQALATLDIIVLTSVDSSQLDRAQLDALQSYVREGGSLLVIGGPSWQETLRPLPSGLLPGRIVGTRVLPDLHGLSALDPGIRRDAAGATEVSLLSHPRGTVVASQSGVPLVVRRTIGQGTVEYLAFDPAFSPIRRSSGGIALLERLVSDAAPLAVVRTWAPLGFRLRFGKAMAAVAVTGELSNAPPSRMPLLEIFAALTLLYLLLLGPVNFLVLRRLRRQHLAWITIPVLVSLYLLSIFGLTTRLRGSTVLLNSVGMLTLDGGSGSHPASLYMGVTAPLPGDYHLALGTSALPSPVPEIRGFSFRNASTLQSSPLGMTVQEGVSTDVTLLSMQRWATRDIALDTAIRVSGTVRGNLRVDAQGNISGPVHNGTSLDLLNPAIVAGQSVTYLPVIRAGATIHVRVQPSDTTYGTGSSVWSSLYGASGGGDGDHFGGFFGGFDGITLPSENTLSTRVQNAATMLTQAQTLSSLGQVVLLGWTDRPLAPLTVDGSAPRQRQLTLVAVPLTVGLPARGAFQLRAGTLGPRLVDLVPRAPQNSGGFFSRSTQEITVGPGGSLTFELVIPNGSHARFRQLILGASIGGDGTSTSAVLDWRTHRWVNIDLSGDAVRLTNPNRFVSPDGQVLLRLQPVGNQSSVTVEDPTQSIQISGAGSVS